MNLKQGILFLAELWFANDGRCHVFFNVALVEQDYGGKRCEVMMTSIAVEAHFSSV